MTTLEDAELGRDQTAARLLLWATAALAFLMTIAAFAAVLLIAALIANN